MADETGQKVLINALLKPEVYPHQVTAIRLIETHISWVILTGSYAYKLKKSVDFGFLDFSSLAKRHHFCEQELRLNQRFSKALYQDVVAITGPADSPEINGRGEVIEYAVRMREFPQQCLLDALAKNGQISAEQVDTLAQQLARFHQSAPAASGAGDPAYGSLASIEQPVMENIQQIRPLLDQQGDINQLHHLQSWATAQLHELMADFEQRLRLGFIRECHGDLHLGNIALIDQQLVFFDCIEFNDQFRWIDTISELAYLLMDFEDKGLHQLANRLLNAYLAWSGDYHGLRLLPFYKSYRAIIRAKVNILRFEQSDISAEEQQKIYSNYQHYMNLAESYSSGSRPFLAITHGLSGSGKSTLSRQLAAQYQAIHLRSDIERKRLFGLKQHEPSGSAVNAGIYTAGASEMTYDRLFEIAGPLLRDGFAVIVDATFLPKRQRDRFHQLAMDCAVPFLILDCQATKTVLLDRIAKRGQHGNDVSEADSAVLENQLQSQDVLTKSEQIYTVSIDTEKPFTFTDIERLIIH